MGRAFSSVRFGWVALILAGVCLSSCSQWADALVARLTPSPSSASRTSGDVETTLVVGTVTPELPISCAFVWSTRSLPDVSTQVNQVLRKMGLLEVEVEASVYGEDCLDTETNQVVRFSALQTNFDFNVALNTVEDPEELGLWLERLMKVLDQFPPGNVPGPVAGTVGVNFNSSSDTVGLWFPREKAKKLLDEGMKGRELFEALRGP